MPCYCAGFASLSLMGVLLHMLMPLSAQPSDMSSSDTVNLDSVRSFRVLEMENAWLRQQISQLEHEALAYEVI